MHKYKKSLTNSLEKIIINKHWKTNACLAQSVEHSAVNRSVGGPSPSTGAKKGRIRRSFFILPLLRGTPWRAKHRSSAHCASTLLPKWTLGKTINKFIFLRYYTGVRVPQQAPLGNKTNTQNGVRFVLSPVEASRSVAPLGNKTNTSSVRFVLYQENL